MVQNVIIFDEKTHHFDTVFEAKQDKQRVENVCFFCPFLDPSGGIDPADRYRDPYFPLLNGTNYKKLNLFNVKAKP